MAEEDLIFGKNQHFFGGMEPSTMIAFSAVVEDGMIKINAQLPNDTIVNGYSLCTVAGAVIRRRSDDYPINEFDGDLVADITTSGTFADSTADPTATYFYAAFPYTTQGVYSINAANQCVANGPEPMVAFSVASEPSKVIITATLPDGAAGAVIRKSTSGYPVSETDGNEFMTITSSGTYTDTDVVGGTTYYYAAFPYTASGIYSRDPADRASVTVVTYQYIFGYDLDITDSDPATRVTYPSDVDNASYTPAAMNFSSGVFNYGSWPSTPGEKFMPKPCMLNLDGTVLEYLDPDNYALQEDGSTASDITSTTVGANAMMEWPKIYTKRWEENNVYHFRCCDIKLDDSYDCWCNYDKNNNEIDHFYTAIYNGALINSSCLMSLSTKSPVANETISNYFTEAAANGSDWTLETVADYMLIRDLLVMMAKTTDGQTAYGRGYTNPTNGLRQSTGLYNTKGLFWGTNNATSGVKVFGMEHWWGNVYRLLAGWIFKEGYHNYKITRGTHDGTTSTDYNTSASGYHKISQHLIGSNNGGFIKTMFTTNFGQFPYSLNGSATTYYCDEVEYYTNSGTRGVMVGGKNTSGDVAGPFAMRAVALTADDPAYGATIACKPSKT